MNVALFASGRGSNVNNILCYFNENEKINIVVVGSNNPNSGALDYAKKHNVPVFTFSKNELNNSNFIINKLQKYDVSLVVLAGFVLKIPEEFISLFKGEIINVHPSLLPKYGGKGMYGDNVHKKILENGEKKSGVTFHFVNENYDEGKIINQYCVNLTSDETLTSLKQKINKLEWEHYPLVIESLCNE